MKRKNRRLRRTIGIAAAASAAAALTAYLTTDFLIRASLDRQQPKLVQKAERILTGTDPESEFHKTVKASARRLAQKDLETVSVTGHDGETLQGHWMPQENARRVIIAMHGWRSSWYNDFGMVADAWAADGCSVLFAEQRAQGESGGEQMGFGLIERYDCLDWIYWVISRCGKEIPIYLCGISMGATTVLLTAGLSLPPSVRGVIADCGFTSPQAIWKHVTRNNLHIGPMTPPWMADAILRQRIHTGSDPISTVDALKSCSVPVLLIHGTDDRLVPVEMTYENYKACASPKRLLVVPGAGHGMSYFVDKDGYESAVKSFWNDCEGEKELHGDA